MILIDLLVPHGYLVLSISILLAESLSVFILLLNPSLVFTLGVLFPLLLDSFTFSLTRLIFSILRFPLCVVFITEHNVSHLAGELLMSILVIDS